MISQEIKRAFLDNLYRKAVRIVHSESVLYFRYNNFTKTNAFSMM